MSLFLGKIHYWLYNKVIKYESIEKEIIEWTEIKNLDLTDYLSKLHEHYGKPLDNRPLEEIIDTSNIHGWLQNKINKAEIRQASLITKILRIDNEHKTDLIEIYRTKGVEAAQDYKSINPNRPAEMYKILNDVILEGMPCDNVSRVLDNTNEEYIWETTMCLHKDHWDKVGGEVDNFYELRDNWISEFVKSLNPNFRYTRIDAKTQKIFKFS